MSKQNLVHLTQGTPQPSCGHLLPSAEKGSDLAVEPYINKKEVARRMGRTTRGVDKMMRRGQIPYYKWGYRCAFRWSEIQQHLAQTCRVLKS